MLIKLSAENFKSFDQKEEFSIVSSSKMQGSKNHRMKIKQTHLLKNAVVYGANSSGKSNLVTAFAFIKTTLMEGLPVGSANDFCRNKEANKERSLHPKLTEQFLKLFMEAHDGVRMQLVFTTHEDTIMDQSFFRRDEIWFKERNADNADNYALIKTYIETCRRNYINEIEALQRLCEGNPYTVQEIFSGTLL